MTGLRTIAAAAAAFLIVGSTAAFADTILRSFTAGSGPGAVGVAVSQGGEDREEDGPQALTTDAQGQLFVLDQLNGRIVKVNPANAAAPDQTLELPKGLQPTDLVVKNDTMYVYDGRIQALSPSGAPDAPTRGLTTTRSGEAIDDATSTAFAQMGSEPDAVDDGTRAVVKPRPPGKQTVDTKGRGAVDVDIAITDRGSGAQLTVRPHDQSPAYPKLTLRVAGRLGTVAFLNIDDAGRAYVLAENVPEDIQQAAFAVVARFSAKGALEGVYEMPIDQTTSVSRRAVAVSPEGDVYFLKTTRKGADIIGLGFRPMPNAKVIALAKPQTNAASLAWADTAGLGMAVGPLTRQRILQTAAGFEGLRWTVMPNNYGPDQDQSCSGFAGRIRRPAYMIGKAGQQVQGVPYCWGCQASLSQFATRIQKGALAGNVCTKDGVRTDVIGVDCSSFVSAAWGLSTHFSTAAIPAIATQVSNPWDLQPGDAFDKPGSHVMLFLGFTPDRQARVMEASPGACQGRVCRNTYPLSSLLSRGFIPVRYRALVGEPAASVAEEK